jgi:hypothetical protein
MRYESSDKEILSRLAADLRDVHRRVEEIAKLRQSTKEALAVHMAVHERLASEFEAKLNTEKTLKSNFFERGIQFGMLVVQLLTVWALFGHHITL